MGLLTTPLRDRFGRFHGVLVFIRATFYEMSFATARAAGVPAKKVGAMEIARSRGGYAARFGAVVAPGCGFCPDRGQCRVTARD